MKTDFSDRAEWYLAFWKKALNGLLGWSEEAVFEWVKKPYQDLKGPSILHHEEPLHYISSLLLPPDLREQLSDRDMMHLLSRMEQFVNSSQAVSPYDEAYDWSKAKIQLDSFLREYRALRTKTDVAARAQWYLGFWKKALANLLGWSEEQVSNWSKSLMEELRHDPLLHTFTPVYFISEVLLGERLYNPESLDLISQIEQLLNSSQAVSPYDEAFDWKKAKIDMNKLLDRHLPGQK